MQTELGDYVEIECGRDPVGHYATLWKRKRSPIVTSSEYRSRLADYLAATTKLIIELSK